MPNGMEFGLKSFSFLLQHADLTAKDDQGATALHIAAELNLSSAITELLLTEEGMETLHLKDRAGLRALHRAAAADSSSAVGTLLGLGASISAQTPNGTTALHLAASSGATKAWEILIKSGANVNITDKYNRTAVEVASMYGWTTTNKGYLTKMNDPVTGEKNTAVTGVLTHPMCVRHFTCPPSETEDPSAPPENIKRLTVLLDKETGCLRANDVAEGIRWVEESRAAALSDVLRVHEWPYVKQIQTKCETVNKDPEGYGGIDNLDGDTTVSHGSFAAAMYAAGSVIQGVDMIMKGEIKNAFCAVRPPGHHAGPRGLVKGDAGGPDSHGFCFLNNISIGAAYALNMHRDTVKRVAIVDFDVHHGNGTEETVRWLTPGLENTDLITPMGFGTISTPRYKPWFDANDPENVMFVSVHGYGPREPGCEHLMPQAAFYPGSGGTVLPHVNAPTDEVISSNIFEKKNLISTEKNTISEKNKLFNEHLNDKNNGNEHGKDVHNMNDFDDDKEGDCDDEKDNDKDDDDKDDDEDENDSDESSGEESNGPHIHQSAQSSKVAGLYKIFQPPTGPTHRETGGAISSAPPLILDIGVKLPGEGGEGSNTSGEYRHQWRSYFREEIFPRLMTFKPDMIFISAGFDAHKKDTINSGYIALVEEDFEWITNNLIRIANSCCEGRVVSALEGGYQIGGEFSSAFAKSVKIHVASLIKGGKSTCAPYLQEDADRERDLERELLDDVEKRRIARIEQQRQLRFELQQAEREAAREKEVTEVEKEGEVEVDAEEVVKEGENEIVESGVVMSSEVEESGSKRKRRRVTVDYKALDEEIQRNKESS
eukprot:CAMPEP_0119048606 /NCGR_PEP_ID=MMETSP1177-20130426/59890_1 /TAXON_ID=2985 /ORGANISM="Ochromonas sp, Strain CCMP1899" /LENGTH=826 /DNA_ID=CAMNT_0007024745 /DNA_START=66 /DNA_END=2546 /DNA_ORIENTATION=+